MFRRPLVEMAVCLILGNLFWQCDAWYLGVAAIIFMLFGGIGLWKEHVWGKALLRVLLLGSFFILGIRTTANSIGQREALLASLKEGAEVSVLGTLTDKEYKNNQYVYYFSNCVISIHSQSTQEFYPCHQLMAGLNSDTNAIGETLIFNGTIQLWNSGVNEGNFDEKSFYEAKGIDCKVTNVLMTASSGTKNSYREWLFQLRMRLKAVYVKLLDETDAGILTTMLLGDKSLLEKETREEYQNAGISHILAISGLHISLIGMSLYRMLRKCRASFGEAGIFAGFVMISYAWMTGMGTSTLRAVFMFLLMLMAQWTGRSYDGMTAMAVSAMSLLLENPSVIFYAGFQFSYAAVTGVICIGQFLIKAKEIESSFYKTMMISFSIQVMTIPLVAYYYFEIPVYSMLVNLVVLPLMGILLGFGLAGGIAGLKISEALGTLVCLPCHWILLWNETICGWCEKLPGAKWIVGRPSMVQMVGYYILLFFLLAAMVYWKKYRLFVPVVLCFLAVLLYHPKGSMKLAVLDVGQGDGIFLQSGSGNTVFFDGGSSNIGKVGTYRILPFLKYHGISKIDCWIISHTDQDHINGFLELVEADYMIGQLVISTEIIRDDAYWDLMKTMEEYQIPVYEVAAGDVLHMGEGNLTFIFPVESYPASDKNAASLVAYYQEGEFKGLFTGDISSTEETYLIQQNLVESVDFYKAAHHGSRYSNSSDFLQTLSPQISVISCSSTNNYGHPGKEAIAHMEEAGSQVFYTMEAGQITISLEKNQILVEKYLSSLDVSVFPVLE